AAAPPAAPAAGDRQTVTLVLTPPDRAGLQQLAHSPGVPRQSRSALLDRLRPTSATRERVSSVARGLGLTVVNTGDPWAVTATASAATIRAAFGSARASDPASPWARSLPRKPTTLDGAVTAVLGGDETRPAKRPLLAGATVNAKVNAPTEGWTGPALRTAYGQSTDGSPRAGQKPLAIATLQFDGWYPADLRGYAAGIGLPDPITSGAFTAVTVAGANPQLPQWELGATEVALDQETLLGVAPHARQRAYFAPNTDTGAITALHRIAADAADASHSYYNLAALSASWGSCEPAYKLSNGRWDPALQAEEDAYAEVAAAGLTVFAASGDWGSDDCPSELPTYEHPSVDYPASSPSVVGVGGTNLVSATNETGWAGSGGGESTYFTRPDYQKALQASRNSHRLVPDIAGMAGMDDPRNGLAVYLSHGSAGSWTAVGGTSVGAPVFAAMLTNVLSAAGYRSGIGDIHPYLYSAPASAFRDITTGSNGTYAARTGYDMVTGLGAPLWDALGRQLTRGPRLTVPTAFVGSGSIPVSVQAPGTVTYTGWKTGLTRPACNGTGWSATPPTSVSRPAGARGVEGPQTVWVLGRTSDGTCYATKAAVTVDLTGPLSTIAARAVSALPPTLSITWKVTEAGAWRSGANDVHLVVKRGAVKLLDTWTTAGGYALRVVPGAGYTVTVSGRDKVGNVGQAATVTVPASLLARWGATDPRTSGPGGAWGRVPPRS
ncbi:MAG: S53 family peptidase, partial [Frankiaceae bacterium]